MLDFALTDAYAPFTISFLLMCGIGLIEAVGFGLGSVDVHADIGVDCDAGPASPLEWLGFGDDMPILIWLTSLLACFTIAGFSIQQIAEAVSSHTLPWLLATAGATPAAMFLNFFAANGLHRILPKTETTALRPDDLVGLRATVLDYEARADRPGRAKIVDMFGQQHFVTLAPHDADPIPPGETVLLVRREGSTFFGIAEDPLAFRPIVEPKKQITYRKD